jgi:CRISPR/Cas system CSM-associated protein Csm5 (group 7 of RAMP superfamily)
METRTWEVTLITPLHIGDGVELQKNLDYLPSREGLRVIDPEDVLARLADNPAAVREIGNTGFDLARMEREKQDLPAPRYILPFQGNRPPDSLRRFLKNGYGAAYLAGSTLKGAVRTALWTSLDRRRLPPVGRFRDFQRGVKSVDGTDPNHDFLRPLSVGDSAAVAPSGVLRASEIKFFNLQRDERPGWKDFSTRRTRNRFEEAAGVFVEAVVPTTKFHLQVRLDRTLTSGPVAAGLKLPHCDGLNGFVEMARQINRHSRAIAEAERVFFSRFGPATAAVRSFYEDLLTGFDSLDGSDGRFIVRMAWGSGWRGMTGDWLSEEDLATVRRETRLGKAGVPIFPKTRRLAMDNGTPCQPLGWAVVAPVAERLFLRSPTASTPSDEPVEPPPSEKKEAAKPSEPEPSAPTSTTTETEVWENVMLTWSPGDQVVTAVGPENNKATGKGKALIPETIQDRLFKKKKAKAAKVVVSVLGNALIIEAIE